MTRWNRIAREEIVFAMIKWKQAYCSIDAELSPVLLRSSLRALVTMDYPLAQDDYFYLFRENRSHPGNDHGWNEKRSKWHLLTTI